MFIKFLELNNLTKMPSFFVKSEFVWLLLQTIFIPSTWEIWRTVQVRCCLEIGQAVGNTCKYNLAESFT